MADNYQMVKKHNKYINKVLEFQRQELKAQGTKRRKGIAKIKQDVKKKNTAATTYNTVSKYSNALGKQGNENTRNTRVCDKRGSKI